VTLPVPNLIRAARAASHAMADRNTAFIFNEWYVVALADGIGRSLFKRQILGRNLVLFRTQDGHPVALDDRCAHRSLPLSAGTLDGDTIVCGYHGFRYDIQGDCIEIPSQAHCPKGIGVRQYPVVDYGPLIWIWMGDPARADPARIPHQPWLLAPDWERSQGYLPLRASYVSLHENLMDLSHLSFLHARTFGTPDYAAAPYEVKIEDAHFELRRSVVPTRLPPVWAEPTGIRHDKAARVTTSEFVSPALHVVTAQFHDTTLPESSRPVFEIRTAHIPTPQSRHSTHYFIVHGRSFALGQPEVTAFMHEQLFQAFNEDVQGLEAVEQALQAAGDDLYEISVGSDRAAVAMRKYLKHRADEELAGPGI